MGELARRFSGPFRVADAARGLELNPSRARRLMAYLTQRGWLTRVRQGLYVVPPLSAEDPARWPVAPWVLAVRSFAPCYIGGGSALHHWGLLGDAPSEVVVFSARRSAPTTSIVHGHHFRVRHTKLVDLFGTTAVEVDGESIPVADRMRALVDVLDMPALGGGVPRVALAVLGYLIGEERDDEALFAYAERVGRRTVFKRLGFLVERCHPGERALVQACMDGISRGISLLDPDGPDEGPYEQRFGLRINVPYHTPRHESTASAVCTPPPFYGRPPIGRVRLAELVRGGETLSLEFKGEARRPLSDTELVEAVTCLANGTSDGVAWLVVGIEDDGTVTGAHPRHPGGVTDTLRVTALISARTRPSLSTRVGRVELEGHEVLVIEVPRSPVPVGTSDGKYVRRAIGGDGRPECVPIVLADLHHRLLALAALDPCIHVVDAARWEDLDPMEFHRFRSTVRARSPRSDAMLLELSDQELAAALGAVEVDGAHVRIRLLALLLFGTEDALRRFVPTHEVAFQIQHGTSVAFNEFMRWPVLRLMEEIEAQFRARLTMCEVLVGMRYLEVPEHAPRALREAIANAIAHRDYTRLGAVHVRWIDRDVVISSPGGLPEGVRLDNVLVVPPHARNLLLADALKRAGVVERIARGVDTIYLEQLRLGRRPPSYFGTDATQVVLTLPGGEPHLGFVRLVVEEGRAGRELGCEDLLVLDALRRGARLTLDEAAKLVQRPDSDIEERLERLVAADLVTVRREESSVRYAMSRTAQTRLEGER